MRRPNWRAAPGLARLGAGLVLALALVAGLATGCTSGSSDGSKDSNTGTTVPAAIKEANAVCAAGKKRTAKIVPGKQVVPSPKTPAEEQATQQWADDTADAFEQTVADLKAIDASGAEADDIDAVVAIYSDAADALRTDPGTVLGDPAFLADQDLYDAGYTTCVIPQPVTTTKGG